MAEVEVTLTGVVNIAKSESLFEELEPHFRDGTPVKINAADAVKLDTSAAQLIYSFVHSMQEAGTKVTWGEVSEEFRNGFRDLGLESKTFAS